MGPGGVVWGKKSRETVPLNSNGNVTYSALLLCPCLFCPNDNVRRSRRADGPRSAHFSTVISPPWITQQISVGKCAHRGASARWERQTSLKIVTWTKQTWKKHHNTDLCVQIRICWRCTPPNRFQCWTDPRQTFHQSNSSKLARFPNRVQYLLF